MPAPSHPAAVELRATLRIQPSGVTLELAGGTHYVIDDRASELWRSFEDAEVIATGRCYMSTGAATAAMHLGVERLRFATPPSRTVPLREILAETEHHGRFVRHESPPGSKLADSPETTFVDARGSEFYIHGAAVPVPAPETAATIRAREVIPDPAYTALPGGPRLWIVAIGTRDAPAIIPCP